ncbi:S8 family serine peptidase [Salinispora sp. H7-4]|uniref:S8 family serine peptidase n=1 Tax=Salinispora sp. H7-4 TaxID=2748321 RepID=UPI0015D3746E|nr:S8 family serine peptidase [Salinispora sp. H7-4]NYT96220.1 S8 family serine peptidase [Salinispora sp. H7-4]
MGKHRSSVLVGVVALAMVATATPTAAQAQAAEPAGTVRNAGGATAVPGSYLVVFKDSGVNRSAVGSSLNRLRSRHGGVVARTYTTAVRGGELRLSAAAAARVAADPAVAYVEQNHTVSLAGTQPDPPSWGLDRIDQRYRPQDGSYTYPNTAGDVTAYILDTGVRTTHTDFGGRATWGTNTLDDNDTDCHGHGTHVAGTVGGTVHGVAKATKLVAVKALDCGGFGTVASVVAAVDWVTANAAKPAVANMSLSFALPSSAIEGAVTNSIDSGVTYTVAAGNAGIDACIQSPARTPAAITVGWTNSTDTRYIMSNYGSCLDIFAPGSSITSAWASSDTSTFTTSGTSMAAPHVAGAAALVLAENPAYTPQQVRGTLVANATSGVVGNPGGGSPNRLLFVDDGTPPPPPPAGCTGTNDTDVAILDLAMASSSITLSDCGRAASATSTVAVNIRHTFRGDVEIDLVAPDGSAYRLKNWDFFDRVDHINETYAVDLSGEYADGTWLLRVRDVWLNDIGYLNTWTLNL